MNYAIVIPAYNESATIERVVRAAQAQSAPVIVVDDGSSDDTAAKVSQLTDITGVTLIRHETNMGKAQSLWDGMQAALQLDVDAVVTLDGDGQHSPEDIPRILSQAEVHPNSIIIGSRLAKKSDIPPKRYYANKIANFWIAWAAGYPITDSQSGFRLYPASLIKQLKITTTRDKSFVFESEVIIKAAQLGVKSQPLKIAAVYAENARPSHFRSVMDIVLITRMVAWSLFTRAMYLPGLYHAVIKPILLSKLKPFSSIGWDGIAMLLLSFIVIALTLGISYFWSLLYCLRLARDAKTECLSTSHNNNCLLLLGMQLQNNKPNEKYTARIQRAITCLQQHPTLKIIILGGITGGASISEAAAGKDALLQAGILSDRITLEDSSQHTLENLKQAQRLISEHQGYPTIISNRFHLPRVNMLANGFNIEHDLCAAEDILPTDTATFARIMIEALYIHWYYVGKIFSHVTGIKHMLERIT